MINKVQTIAHLRNELTLEVLCCKTECVFCQLKYETRLSLQFHKHNEAGNNSIFFRGILVINKKVLMCLEWQCKEIIIINYTM